MEKVEKPKIPSGMSVLEKTYEKMSTLEMESLAKYLRLLGRWKRHQAKKPKPAANKRAAKRKKSKRK